ncbi:MAG: hypothetical protein Ct9H300mP1_09460 [Planctomycetaceae bacterium]|nr:MAG: hypothetical protein Ct9H300mP1_09460 [Planctomycetaceae bacterium]
MSSTIEGQGRDRTRTAVCVTWLCHLVGDVHQPCHSTASFTARRFLRGDRGGNDVPIRGDKKDINLHMYWDGPFGQTRRSTGKMVRRAAALLADRKLVAAGAEPKSGCRGKPGWPKVTGWPGTWSIPFPILAAIGSGERGPGESDSGSRVVRGLRQGGLELCLGNGWSKPDSGWPVCLPRCGDGGSSLSGLQGLDPLGDQLAHARQQHDSPG